VSWLVREQHGHRSGRVVLGLRSRTSIAAGDICGELVVEIRLDVPQGLLPAFPPVHLRDAFKIALLVTGHAASIRRPIYDGVAAQPLSSSQGSCPLAMHPTSRCKSPFPEAV